MPATMSVSIKTPLDTALLTGILKALVGSTKRKRIGAHNAIAIIMPRYVGLTDVPLYAPRVSASTSFTNRQSAIELFHYNLLPFATMSDYEDEMDVDAPPVKESVMFSSDNTNTKGKRSAANLPVEAEDSLPW